MALAGFNVGTVYVLGSDLIAGRSINADVQLDDFDVSRMHCRFREHGTGSWTVTDLNSRNGTWINGRRLEAEEAMMLQYGDVIELGGTVLRFTHVDDLEERAQHVQRLATLGRLAGGIVHDFNNLLAANLATAAALRSYDLPPDAVACVDDLEQSALHMAELTRKILGIARLQKSQQGPVQLDTVLREVVDLTRRTLATEVKIVCDIQPNLKMRGDRQKLMQVFLNVIVNARDAMPHGGTIEVRARHKNEAVIVEVIDEGDGMDEETRARMFEPFFTTKPEGKGTGLGLSTAWAIVTQHGGTLDVDSTPGSGSSFKVVFPGVGETRAHQRSTTVRMAWKPPTVAHPVVVVDDTPVVRRAICRMLQGIGIKSVPLASAAEAIAYYSEGPEISMMMIDLRMPDMRGEDLIAKLKASGTDLPMVAMSGDLAARQHPELRGMPFLAKPFSMTDLERVLDDVLG